MIETPEADYLIQGDEITVPFIGTLDEALDYYRHLYKFDKTARLYVEVCYE